MLLFEICISCILESELSSYFGELFVIPFCLSQEEEYEIEEECNPRIDKHISTTCRAEYMTDRVQCFWDKCKEEESSSNGEKDEKMQRIEPFTTSNIIGDV